MFKSSRLHQQVSLIFERLVIFLLSVCNFEYQILVIIEFFDTVLKAAIYDVKKIKAKDLIEYKDDLMQRMEE